MLWRWSVLSTIATVVMMVWAQRLGIVSWKIWVGIAVKIVEVIDPIVPIIITVITATVPILVPILAGDHKKIEPKMDGRRL